MILTKNLDCFKSFVADAESATVPFRIIGTLTDTPDTISVIGAPNNPPKKFTIKFLLYSSMATVMFTATLPIEEKTTFVEYISEYNIRLVNKLTYTNGYIACE